jgi:hypothetical protein
VEISYEWIILYGSLGFLCLVQHMPTRVFMRYKRKFYFLPGTFCFYKSITPYWFLVPVELQHLQIWSYTKVYLNSVAMRIYYQGEKHTNSLKYWKIANLGTLGTKVIIYSWYVISCLRYIFSINSMLSLVRFMLNSYFKH